MAHQSHDSYIQRTVFVGNLPPDAAESQLKQICAQVGDVVMFRIIYDRQTGKPKGHGFCEYADPKLVDSAVRNLDGRDYKGYTLFVRRADSEAMKHHTFTGSKTQGNRDGRKKKSKSSKKSVDEISRVVSQLTTAQKREILSKMKNLIGNNEEKAKDFLIENPQLAQALLLIQIQFDLVQVSDIKALTEAVQQSKSTPVKAPMSSKHGSASRGTPRHGMHPPPPPGIGGLAPPPPVPVPAVGLGNPYAPAPPVGYDPSRVAPPPPRFDYPNHPPTHEAYPPREPVRVPTERHMPPVPPPLPSAVVAPPPVRTPMEVDPQVPEEYRPFLAKLEQLGKAQKSLLLQIFTKENLDLKSIPAAHRPQIERLRSLPPVAKDKVIQILKS